MNAHTPWLVFLIPLVLTAGAALLFLLFKGLARADRADLMLRLAAELDMRYVPRLEGKDLPSLPPCSILDKGMDKTVRNLVTDRRGRRFVFDCELHSERNTAGLGLLPDLYLVAMARHDRPAVPRMCVYASNWLGGPPGVPDLFRLDLDQDPAFGRDYLVGGTSHLRARSVLRASVRRAIRSWREKPHPVVELSEGWVAAYLESDPASRTVHRRAAELLRYAGRVAKALGPEGRAP